MLHDGWGRFVTPLLIVVAGVGFTAQLYAGAQVLGPMGLLLLGVPGFLISQADRPRPLSWPEVTLVTLGATLIITVIVGILSAMSPRGLDATSTAASELLVLGAASLAFVVRSRGRAAQPRIRLRVAPRSIVAGAMGLILAGAGFVVATRSAQTQQDASVMQFWAVASTPGDEPTLGLRNATGTSVDCSIAVTRPDREGFDVAVGAVADGASWSGALPAREVSDTSNWQIALQCHGDDRLAIQRHLFVRPAGS